MHGGAGQSPAPGPPTGSLLPEPILTRVLIFIRFLLVSLEVVSSGASRAGRAT